MIAYQNNIDIKKLCLAKLNIANKENKLMQNNNASWDWHTGTPVGCIIQHENRSVELFSKKFGFVQELIDLEEYVFNNIHYELAYNWSMNFFTNIEVGQDTTQKWNQIKIKILTDSNYGVLSSIAAKIDCSVSKNIIYYISENIYKTKIDNITNLMESTLNPLVNDAITQNVFQDIIDIIDIIKTNQTNILWVFNKTNINNIVKIINQEIGLQY